MSKYITADMYKNLLLKDESPSSDIIITKTVCFPNLDEDDEENLIIKKVKGKERTIQAIISNGSVDRSDDIVDPNGWKLKDFKKSGVVLWAHNSSLPPIAKPIDTWISRKGKKQLLGTAQFTPEDMNHPLGEGFGHTIYRMYVEGFMKAVSAGFRSKKWEWSDDKGRPGGIDYKEQDLIEWSPVPVPANKEALAVAKSNGINLNHLYNWCEYSLDSKDFTLLNSNDFEEYHSTLKTLKETVLPKHKKEEDLNNNKDNLEMKKDKPITLKDLRTICKQVETTLIDKIINELGTLDKKLSVENFNRLKKTIKSFESTNEIIKEDPKTIANKEKSLDNENNESENENTTEDDIDISKFSLEDFKEILAADVKKNLENLEN